MKGEFKKLAILELRQKGKKRTKRGEEKRGKLANITLIDERPEEVDSRGVPGHWEGDLIIPGFPRFYTYDGTATPNAA
jgi:IS30 family transposase